ncbi:MAG: hypothetical protein M5R36_10910 [Deltaproteobacteria bacterium]|nr:hypothetical protein [Deltaproteobacteria bacterium]
MLYCLRLNTTAASNSVPLSVVAFLGCWKPLVGAFALTSKSSIDKAGRELSAGSSGSAMEQHEQVFDEYRKSHLKPLSEMTLEVQQWLAERKSMYWVAQRLKRKPQILRKLKRFSVRLTQLQDIGGARIVVNTNAEVESLLSFLKVQVSGHSTFSLKQIPDTKKLLTSDK